MTTTQVVKTSVTNNSLSEDYPHLDDHAKQISHWYSYKLLQAPEKVAINPLYLTISTWPVLDAKCSGGSVFLGLSEYKLNNFLTSLDFSNSSTTWSQNMTTTIKLWWPTFLNCSSGGNLPFPPRRFHTIKELKKILLRWESRTISNGFCSQRQSQPCLLRHRMGTVTTSCYVSYSCWICWLRALWQLNCINHMYSRYSISI